MLWERGIDVSDRRLRRDTDDRAGSLDVIQRRCDLRQRTSCGPARGFNDGVQRSVLRDERAGGLLADAAAARAAVARVAAQDREVEVTLARDPIAACDL